MTDVELLKKKIDASGLKRNFIAKQLNITPQGLHKKTSGVNQFTGDQIQRLCKLLQITSQREIKALFFAEQVDVKSTEVGD